MLHIENLEFSRQNTSILSQISFTLVPGEFLTVLGPSGCGKSTLLRLISGLEIPDSGEIRLNGEIITHKPPQQRGVAMVFQDYALYPHLTVRGNLEFPLRMMKLNKREIATRVEQVAGGLHISDILKRKPGEISGGQKQRVAMGRALVREPKLFLLDEPLSNLDAHLRVQIRSEIARLQQQSAITSIYVTHDQTEAMSLGHRVAVLNQGRLLQLDTPQNLYDHPANVFVAGFIGNPGMNLIRATVLKRQGRVGILIGQCFLDFDHEHAGIAKRMEAYMNQELQIGVRPENVYRCAQGLAVHVIHTEYNGYEYIIRANTEDGQSMIWRNHHGASQPDLQSTLTVAWAPQKTYFFDSDGAMIHGPGGDTTQ